jgi:hypothetical protein
MSFRPTMLFEDWRRREFPVPFPDELEAVRTGKKPLSFISAPREWVTSSTEFARLASNAFERGLTVVLAPEPITDGRPVERQHVPVFVIRRDQLWRIPAYQTVWRTGFEDGRRSDAAERQVSTLFGYSPAQIDEWLRCQRWQRAAYTCMTAYTLVTAEQRRRILALGQRSLGTSDELVGTKLFTDRRAVLRRNAASLVPRGTTLARVGVTWDVGIKLVSFEKARGLLAHGVVTAELAEPFTRALITDVELLTRRGWDGPRVQRARRRPRRPSK